MHRIGEKWARPFAALCSANGCTVDLKAGAATFASTSTMATRFSPEHPARSSNARPAEPTQAIFSFSFGDLYPRAFNEGVLPKPPLGTAAESSGPYRKYVRRADGRAVVELFTAIYRSSHTGMPVCLPL